ncbi:hypothetical protein [Psychrobacillus sp. BL-248-WT-3]|uniref:hypothetical protein n=1 Tax=Psychrobacillus sp. BL-248-WT-3 TaxID=2725306 RepID=UPI00146E0570|nr:hypothetical protein [Psychrobacillus sp. BL-248-WT-3]NME06877.1 hypothetical protein [Psychrobacillus sp. BL-248-WT-3]
MCFSTNVIEQQALIISDKIIKNSIYKPVSLDFISEKNVGIQDFTMQSSGKDISLITRINLENNEGLQISVEPNENGLRYAMGEISYKDYKKLQNQESRQFIWYFFAISSVFLLISWATFRWFFI